MASTPNQQKLIELQDREAIRDCMHRYSRAIDRRDFDLLRTVFWEGAVDEHGAYNGPVEEFYNWASERTVSWERTMHSLSQIIIDLKGNEAAVESYFTAFHKKPKPNGGGWFDEYVAGRYLDRMLKKGDEWRIQHRIVAFEWFRHMPDSFEFEGSPFGVAKRGGRYPDDPMYALFKGII